ncbi:DUF885 domain-containing protein [Massilia sp. H6]|uniref:DUF885 domain-containing protein n=1 Tax=Massilia sp. H6 TaxID=2970464 RepID=UPI0021699274|nr:DUF885 domain-containing protein [Massilia sp. H6]UVW28640.1 DUF885 domain-containing protein [Massilia sp. H6]
MMKTKIALAVLLASFALTPVSAKTTKPSKGKAKAGKVVKSTASDKRKKAPVKKAAMAAAAAAPVAAAAAPGAATSEKRLDRRFDTMSMQYVTALWRLDPEGGIYVGKFDHAANLTLPDAATRARKFAFATEWREKFGKLDVRQLSPRQRTDLALLVNKLDKDRWHLSTWREHEWNPSMHNIAQPLDLILNTDYAAKPQRLRTILKRLANVPAYYDAAQASIVNPTREHTQLAIGQAPGTLAVLADLGKAAQESILTAQEKALFARRVANAGSAVLGYVDFLITQDKRMTTGATTPRPFRAGKSLYEQKFALEIASSSSAEQTFRKALATREELLTRMDTISDELWPRYMAGVNKPRERFQKIGMLIDKLSARHVARENFLPEIRRQIPLLHKFVTERDLLTLDADKPLEVRETPMYQRGVAGASIDAPGPYRPKDKTYYNVTPLDGLSPQQAESSLREYNEWILQILNIHEAIPGHYAQLVHANRSPSLVKSLFGNGAMVEGWAVYGERMMLENGYGDNAPEMWLMYSKWNLRSVTNTILDYSVHVLGMQQPEAIDLLVRQAFQTRQEADEKWRRVTLTSVQLTSYYSGYEQIMELRERRKQQLGERFNLKEFHDQFLSYGNAPVKMISELMQ